MNPSGSDEEFLTQPRATRKQRRAEGKARRAQVPLGAHGELPPMPDRPDPVAILRGQESSREPQLVPLRYERMVADPFAFLRGAAAIMASDLSRVPSSGINVQLCGDAHLANFGMFASAERNLVFDLNDFDETLPGPFEWDVKRLAASLAVSARTAGFKDKDVRKAARAAAQWYRGAMMRLSDMRTMDVWNARLDVDTLLGLMDRSTLQKATAKASAKSRRSSSETALPKLTEVVDGRRRFRSQPPILIPVPAESRDAVAAAFAPIYAQYLRTVSADRIALLAKFSFVDIAHKVVGVGSVGTRAVVLLLESGDGEPLLLQIKQANPSVLEPYLGASQFDNAGKRVVIGQRLMQVTSDPFLGWLHTDDGVDYYLRQLKDMKASIDVTLLDRTGLVSYGQLCGAILARAHARAGDPSMISGYLGSTDAFEEAVASFAMGYVEINATDHAALVADRSASERAAESEGAEPDHG